MVAPDILGQCERPGAHNVLPVRGAAGGFHHFPGEGLHERGGQPPGPVGVILLELDDPRVLVRRARLRHPVPELSLVGAGLHPLQVVHEVIGHELPGLHDVGIHADAGVHDAVTDVEGEGQGVSPFPALHKVARVERLVDPAGVREPEGLVASRSELFDISFDRLPHHGDTIGDDPRARSLHRVPVWRLVGIRVGKMKHGERPAVDRGARRCRSGRRLRPAFGKAGRRYQSQHQYQEKRFGLHDTPPPWLFERETQSSFFLGGNTSFNLIR